MLAVTPIHALFARHREPHAIVCHNAKGEPVSWQNLLAHVCSLAASISQHPARRWLVSQDEALDFLIELLAILLSGKEAVIPPNTLPATIAELSHTYDAIASAQSASEAPPTASTMPDRKIDPHATILHLYTSGSTGKPKQIRKTLAQLEAEIETLEMLWGANMGTAAVIATVPHHHIYGLLFRLLWPLSVGRVFDTVICSHPDTIYERLFLLGNAVLVSSPAQLTRLPALLPLPTLKPLTSMIFSSGGAVPASTAQEFHALYGTAPTEILGSTESGGIAWRCQSQDEAWTPLPGVTIAQDEQQAMIVRSPFLGSSSPLRMEDAIILKPDQRFHLAGRLDRVVKLEEKRLSLPEIETALMQHAMVSEAAVTVISGTRNYLGAVATLSESGQAFLASQGKRALIKELKQHLGLRYEPVLLPRYWRFLEQLPLNERGKLTPDAIASLFNRSSSNEGACAAA